MKKKMIKPVEILFIESNSEDVDEFVEVFKEYCLQRNPFCREWDSLNDIPTRNI